MNPEIKALWVAALRSGRYRQGDRALRKYIPINGGYDTYCCLGVLCDLHVQAVESGFATWERRDSDGLAYRYIGSDGKDTSTSTLTRDVMEWAGLSSDNPQIETGDHRITTLSECNDAVVWHLQAPATKVKALNFHQIADLIEAQL